MNGYGLIRLALMGAFGTWMCQAVPALAADPPHPPGAAEHAYHFDWVRHTQHTLDELKSKLNLLPNQQAAWDAWSGGVLADARRQVEQKPAQHEDKDGGRRGPDDMTTPERMAHGIERLRAQSSWMQEHLVHLEAALARTRTFYDALDTNQKTIFDLFWHEVHHRSEGHDDGWPRQDDEGYGPGAMRGEHDGPAGY